MIDRLIKVFWFPLWIGGALLPESLKGGRLAMVARDG
jgi:hypothetical protein